MNDIERIIADIKKYPYKVAVDVGFKDVREYPHNEWMQNIIFGKEDYTLLAHRGSYKSSVLSVCIALIMVLKPYENIIFLRKADNDVSEMIRMVKQALDSKAIKALALTLYKKPLVLKESTASTITTNLFMTASGSSQLLGIGIKSSITGKHAGIVITDDICNISDRVSRAERENTKTQYQELQNIRNRGGRIINTGTKWHAEDVFTLTKNINVYDYHKTGLISDEQIEEIRQSMIPSLFSCNYELRIIASEDVIFMNPQMEGTIAEVLNGTGHLDSAFYGEDYTAYTFGNVHDGKIYILGKMKRKHVEDCYPSIVSMYNETLCSKLYNEDNADKGMVARDLRKQGLKVVTYHESMNKHIKIVTHLYSAWRDIRFVEGTDQEYIDQILDYTEDAAHDDAPDSLASLVMRIGKKRTRSEEPVPFLMG